MSRRDGLTCLLVAAVALALLAWLGPTLDGVSWRYDEGLNVAKAQLMREGYSLYGEIWSDQPPAFTVMLVAAFRLLGQSVAVGRGLVLALSVAGLVALAVLGRWLGGGVGAVVAAALYALLPHFQELARLIMIGLPALSLALVSMALAVTYRGRTRSPGWPLLVGFAFSLSLLIKPITAPMLAPLGVLLLEGADGERLRLPSMRTALLLALGLALPAVAALGLFGVRTMLSQIGGTLVEARSFHGGALADNSREVWGYLVGDKWGLAYTGMLALAGLGLAWLGWRRRWRQVAFLGSWGALMVLALLLQSPLRRHHLLMAMPPIVLAASTAVHYLFTMFKSVHLRSKLGIAALTITSAAALVMAVQVAPLLRADADLKRAALTLDDEAVARLEALQYLEEQTLPASLIITDDPMLAFKSGRRIPPELAVPSARRVEAGELAGDALIALTRQSSPAAVVLWEQRLTRAAGYWDWVRSEYYAVRAFRDERWIYAPEGGLGRVTQQPAVGDTVALLGSAFGSLAVEPGGELEVTVLLQARQAMAEDLTLFVHLLDDQGELWGQMDQPPLDGWYPTRQWKPGERVAQKVGVQVSPDAPSGEMLLAVGLYGREGRIPLHDGAGTRLGGDQVILTDRPVVRWERMEAPAPEQAADGVLGAVTALEGYDLESAQLTRGEEIDITFHWRALAPMLTSYTVFVHLVGEEGQVVAQRDQRPGDGRYPTTGWAQDELILDLCRVSLDESVAPGVYRLRVGMYDLATGERLPVAQDGQMVEGRFVTLGTVIQVMP